MRTLHLFAGAGGGLLADLILGHEPVCAVEWDAYCCAVLRERAAEGWFPGLHVHEGDVRLFDPSPWAGRVDCVHAGFPCQDISVAGSGAGIDGERSGLYREVLRVADVVRPRFIFLENSPAIVARGLDRVLGDLAARGYDARWTVLAAADVGAPHRRERWWCLCWRSGGTAGVADADGGAAMADADGQRGDRLHERVEPGHLAADAQWRSTNGPAGTAPGDHGGGVQGQGTIGSGEGLANADGVGSGARPRLAESREPDLRDADRRGGRGAERPREARLDGWSWSVEPDVGRVAHGVASRVDRLRGIGNGQVPLCAATAWRLLGGG